MYRSMRTATPLAPRPVLTVVKGGGETTARKPRWASRLRLVTKERI